MILTSVPFSTEVGTEKLGADCPTTGAIREEATDLSGTAQANKTAIVKAETVLRLTIV